MAILNSIVGGLVVGSIKVGGAVGRVGVKAAYGLGEAGAHGLRVGEIEYDRQVEMTNETIAVCKTQQAASAARFEAMKLARLAGPAQAAPVMVAAPAGKAAKA